MINAMGCVYKVQGCIQRALLTRIKLREIQSSFFIQFFCVLDHKYICYDKYELIKYSL